MPLVSPGAVSLVAECFLEMEGQILTQFKKKRAHMVRAVNFQASLIMGMRLKKAYKDRQPEVFGHLSHYE